MDNNYISVSQVNNYIKNIFDAEIMLQNIFIYGEVGTFNISNGIAYFNLKDENGILPCVLFNAKMFKQPQIGDMVLVKGSISYYAKGGKLSFNAISLQEYGRGMLYEKYLELKNKLEAKGYFNVERKKEIPKFAKKIGVVSSETGAVIQDIIDVTHRRNNLINITLFPVKVQGVGAEKEIANGINFFNTHDVDLVIVARGGGSMEDLQPFNTEIVAEAIFNSTKPIISAVGHETDFTICDFVSDLRAPTPSAAAEIVAWSKHSYIDYVQSTIKSIENRFELIIKNTFNKIELIYKNFKYGINKINSLKGDVINKFISLYNNIILYIERNISKNELLNGKLNVLNPKIYSEKGLFKIYKDGIQVKDLNNLEINDLIKIESINTEINAKISK